MPRMFRAASLLMLAACTAPGQETAPPLSFEVASIKPAPPPVPGQPRGSRNTPGGIQYDSVSLRNLIVLAYRVKDFQVSGPAWLGDGRWQIIAKSPQGATPTQIPEMLQSLLAERFKLQFHREKKEFSGHALVAASGGPKLKPAEDVGAPTASGPSGPGRGSISTRVSFGPSGGRMEFKRITVAGLAANLSNLLGRPVIDETGVTGQFDIELEFSGEEAQGGMMFVRAPAAGGTTNPAESASDPGASIFASLQKLGLKLESRKVSLDVIVVDRAEKTPTEN